jgi:FtsH-binding integral membrane protein
MNQLTKTSFGPFHSKYSFMAYTLANLCVQTMFTMYIAYIKKDKKVYGPKWAYLICSVILYIILSFSTTFLPVWIQLALFFGLSYVNGIVLSGLIKSIPDREMKEMILQTLLIFVTAFSIGWIIQSRGMDISPLVYATVIFTFIMFISLLYTIFVDTSTKTRKMIRFSTIALMAAYIVVETYFNFSKEYDNNVIKATLDYYMDIYNIFSNLSSNQD